MNRKILIIVFLSAGLFGQQLSDSLRFDPATGRPYKLTIKKHFDPESGKLTIERDTLWAGKIKPPEEKSQPDESLNLTTHPKKNFSFDPLTGDHVEKDELRVISLARAHAMDNYNKKMWTYCGGPVTCGSLVLGGMVGGSLLGAGGAIFGTIGAGVLAPEFISRIPSQKPILYPREFTPEEKELYKKIYKEKLKEKRVNGMYNGTLFGCGVLGFTILFITMMI